MGKKATITCERHQVEWLICAYEEWILNEIKQGAEDLDDLTELLDFRKEYVRFSQQYGMQFQLL